MNLHEVLISEKEDNGIKELIHGFLGEDHFLSRETIGVKHPRWDMAGENQSS